MASDSPIIGGTVFVKALKHESVYCQASECDQPAEYLFRHSGRVWAQCLCHARMTANKERMKLPTGPEVLARSA
jgi:hypothetical protein